MNSRPQSLRSSAANSPACTEPSILTTATLLGPKLKRTGVGAPPPEVAGGTMDDLGDGNAVVSFTLAGSMIGYLAIPILAPNSDEVDRAVADRSARSSQDVGGVVAWGRGIEHGLVDDHLVHGREREAA